MEIGPGALDRAAWAETAAEPLMQQAHLERDLRSVMFNCWMHMRGATIIACVDGWSVVDSRPPGEIKT